MLLHGRRLFLAQMVAPASILFFADPARAQSSAVAEKLFQEGRRLLLEGKTAEACERFQKSQEIEPSAGTLLNLAGCREANGQLASAWKAYTEARTAAVARNRRDWEATAKDKASTLEPRLPHVTIHLADKDAAATLDGAAVAPKELDAEIPIDPGRHTIVVKRGSAPAYTTTFDAVEGAGTKVEVPSLEEGPQKIGAPPPREKSAGIEKPIAFGLIGLGAVGVGVGVITGLLASGKQSSAEDGCPALKDPNAKEPVPCPQAANSDNESAHTLGTISTLAFVGGAALAAGGVALYFLAPSDKKEKVAVRPLASPTSFGTSVTLHF